MHVLLSKINSVHLFALQLALSVGSNTKMLRPRPKLHDEDQKYMTSTMTDLNI